MDFLAFAAVAVIITLFIKAQIKKRTSENFVDVILVTDISVPLSLPPLPGAVASLFRYEQDVEQRATFRLSTVSDSLLSPANEAYMAGWRRSSPLNTEKSLDFRPAQIREFFDQIRAIISSHGQTLEGPKPQSLQCYRRIAAELGVFRSADEKMLVVHSGLNEKSDLFDYTLPADKERLLSNPALIARRFGKAHRLKNLKGVDVFFVYKPTGREDELRYACMVQVYRILLEKAGASVRVSLTNENYYA